MVPGLFAGPPDGMAAELLPECGQQLCSHGAILAGAETLLQGGGDGRNGYGEVDGLLNGPAALAGVFDIGLKALE